MQSLNLNVKCHNMSFVKTVYTLFTFFPLFISKIFLHLSIKHFINKDIL